MYKKHLFSLSLTLIIVMLFSALGPTAVYADDGAPADPPAADSSGSGDEAGDEGDAGGQTDEAGDGEAATEEEAADEASEGDVEEAVTDEAATEEPAEASGDGEADEAAAEEPGLIEQVPDNTEVVVINAEGVAEPLATQEAANAVAASDPIWCPAGVGPGGAGCTGSYSSFDDLLTFLKDNESDAAYQQAGTIYVEMGNYGGGESSVDFNTYGFTTFDDNDLTIQGGWNTSDNTTTATTTFDIPIVIGSDVNPWGGSLTLRNIIVSGVVNDVGLTVYSAGSVTVEDSEFTNNDTAGVFIDADDDVTVRRSKINDNGSNDWNVVDGKGLEIKSGGYVTLSDVEANDNQIFGADVESVEGVAIANSFFNGNLMYTVDFAEFFGYGLTVVSQGDIALSGVQANENFLWGASLTGPRVFIENSFFNMNVSDSTSFIDDTGLIIVSAGDVALDNIEANENRLIGADILAGGQVDIANSSFSGNYGITVDASGNNVYWGCGLQIGGVLVGELAECGRQTSPAAVINLIAVTADNNYFFGANLFSSGDVNISNSSFSNVSTTGFPQEQLEGLKIQSGDEVTLSTVTVNNNKVSGADITASGDVRVDTSSFFNNQGGTGLSAKSTLGDIYLDLVTASSNGVDGAYLETSNRYVCLNGGEFINNGRYGVQVVTSTLEITGSPTFDPNGQGNIFGTLGPCPDVIFTSVGANSTKQAGSALYTVVSQAQGQLPGALGQGNTFVSALLVTLTNQAAGNLAIELSFPIPAGMENADLVVMFWDGSGWVEVPGGSVVNAEFVITVSQPGIYVLVSR